MECDTRRGPSLAGSSRIFVAFFTASVIGYFAYIVAYGVNVVFWDDWSWAALLPRGEPTLASLWVQHNESITFFPNVLAYALIKLTAWNTIAFFWISGILLMGVLALIIRVFGRRSTSPPRMVAAPVSSS